MTPSPWLIALFLVAPLLAAAVGPGYRTARAKATRDALLAGDEGAWAAARIVAFGPAPYETRFRGLWNPEGLFLRFDADDSAPWHTMTQRDEHLWEEEVVEIFLDLDRSGRDYYELEINPANVVCDLRMISGWPDKKGDIDWNLEGLLTRVVDLEKAGRTSGWTALAFLPWSGFRSLPSAKTIALPPRPGDAWRLNLFRIKRPGGPKAPENGAIFAAWSKPPGESFHAPDVFRDLVFEP